MIHPQNLYDQPPQPRDNGGKYGLIVSLSNVIGYLLACGITMAVESNPGILFFYYGLIFSALNLASMIVFIVLKKPMAWILSLIFFFLFPIIGFFSCSLGMTGAF